MYIQDNKFNIHEDLQKLRHILLGDLSAEKLPPYQESLKLAQVHQVVPQVLDFYSQLNLSDAEMRDIQEKKWRFKLLAVQYRLAMQEVIQILSQTQIPMIWLKGLALAHTVYPSIWLRQMVDIDVLIPYERRLEALRLMQVADYIVNDELLEEASHHYVFVGSENKGVNIEVHYHLASLHAIPNLSSAMDWFWEQTRVIATEFGEINILSNEALLLHLVIHDIFQHELLKSELEKFDSIVLRRKYDLYLLLKHETLDWELLITKAREWEWSYALLVALWQCQILFNIAIPPFVIEALQNEESSDKLYDERHSKALRQQLRYVQIFLKLNNRNKLAYLLKIVFPSRKQLEKLYPNVRKHPFWRLYYIHRLLSITLRSIKIVVRLLVEFLQSKFNAESDK